VRVFQVLMMMMMIIIIIIFNSVTQIFSQRMSSISFYEGPRKRPVPQNSSSFESDDQI